MFSEPNTLDNSYLFIDFAVLRELYITDIEEMMRNLDARLFPVRPPVRYEDHGVVWAECGCLDFIKTFWDDPHARLRELGSTHYHGPQCVAAWLPMDHTEVKDLPDHLHVPIFIEMMEQLNVAIEKGAFPPSHNFFKADAIGNLAEIARAKVNSLDSLSTTRNWAEGN